MTGHKKYIQFSGKMVQSPRLEGGYKELADILSIARVNKARGRI